MRTAIVLIGTLTACILANELSIFPEKLDKDIDIAIYLGSGLLLGVTISENNKRDKFKHEMAQKITSRINRDMKDKETVSPMDILTLIEQIKEEEL